MNNHKRLKLSMAISGVGLLAFCNSALAQQQVSPELDITISVIEEGETPAGFVNRLVLPPLSSLNGVQTNLSSTLSVQTTEIIESDANDLINVVTEIGTDNIRETISIDGTTNVSANGDINVDAGGNAVISLPGNIVDILSPTSPLQNTLQETVDQANGVLGTVVDGISPNGAIVDSLSPVVRSTEIDVVTSVVTDTVVDTQLTGIVENIEPAASTNLGSTVQGFVEEQRSLSVDEIPALPNESPLPIEDISDELREVPLL